MISKPVDSLDLVEAVMFVEEIFGIDVPETTENFGSPDDMVDWLELHISNQRPNKQAVALLKKLATDHNQPELGERLDGTWRREQITAIIREIFQW